MVSCSPSPRTPQTQPPQQADLPLFVCPFTAVVDTREQAPWTFQQIVIARQQWVVPRKAATLQTGDYSIEGHEHELTIERKSSQDLIGSVTAGNARFRREHERMKEMVEAGGFACVIVEGCFSAICDELERDREMGRTVSPELIMGVVASWPARYRVPWVFAGDRRRAEQLAFRVMLKWWKEVYGG